MSNGKRINLFREKKEPIKNVNDKVFDMMTAVADKTDVNINFSDDKKTSGTEGIHTTLAVAGMVPGIGNVADIMDAALYGLEGDKLGLGLSLMSAIPFLGLAAGGAKIAKGGKKAAEIAKIQKRQVTLVEGAQSIVKKYGFDPSDTKLVSNVADMVSDTAKQLDEHGKKFDFLVNRIGVPFDDALSVMSYLDSITPRAIKARKDMIKSGYTALEIFGKEAVDDMTRLVKKGKKLYKDDPIFKKLLEGE